MSRLGQLRSLKKVSNVFIGRGRILSRKNNVLLVQISDQQTRALSALTPILCCKSPDGAGPSPPPTSGGSSGSQKGKFRSFGCDEFSVSGGGRISNLSILQAETDNFALNAVVHVIRLMPLSPQTDSSDVKIALTCLLS